MNNWWIGFLAGFIPAAAAAVLGWVKWWHELREKRRERAGREKAEAELVLIQRRSFERTPYLMVTDQRFEGLQIADSTPGRSLWVSAGQHGLLAFLSEEVPRTLPPGHLVLLAVANQGRDALEAVLQLDNEPADLLMPENPEAAGVLVISYAYRPELHGKAQTLTMKFLRADGTRDVHRYEIKHGIRWLRRVDPA